jgi:hypothetical protein
MGTFITVSYMIFLDVHLIQTTSNQLEDDTLNREMITLTYM